MPGKPKKSPALSTDKAGDFYIANYLQLHWKSSTDQDNNQQSQDSIQLREYGHYHCCTEYVVTCTYTGDTVCTNFCLTDRRKQTCKS